MQQRQHRETNSHPAVFAAALGAIPLGSSTAFLDLTGSFIILSTVSYAIPMLANVLTGRKYFPKGPFHLGRLVFAINIIAVVLIIFFNIMFCFRE
jgi:choline transport protein